MIVADAYGGEILRDPAPRALPPAARRAALLRFAIAAADRLHRLADRALSRKAEPLRSAAELANMDSLGRRITAMRNWALASVALLIVAAGARAESLTLTSPDLAPGARVADAQVGDRFGCAGGDHSPALAWSGAPAGAKSFAVSLFDPDAPTGHGFWHWTIFDIPAIAASLPAGAGDPTADAAPRGALQGENEAGSVGYFGPCPPAGDKPHHYRFELDALDVAKLGLDAGAPATIVIERARRHTLAKATLTGVWSR